MYAFMGERIRLAKFTDSPLLSSFKTYVTFSALRFRLANVTDIPLFEDVEESSSYPRKTCQSWRLPP